MERIKQRQKEDDSIPKHLEMEEWLNALFIDLKKQLLGFKPAAPITLDRLGEWDQKGFRAELGKCKSHIRKRYF